MACILVTPNTTLHVFVTQPIPHYETCFKIVQQLRPLNLFYLSITLLKLLATYFLIVNAANVPQC